MCFQLTCVHNSHVAAVAGAWRLYSRLLWPLHERFDDRQECKCCSGKKHCSFHRHWNCQNSTPAVCFLIPHLRAMKIEVEHLYGWTDSKWGMCRAYSLLLTLYKTVQMQVNLTDGKCRTNYRSLFMLKDTLNILLLIDYSKCRPDPSLV